MPIPVVASTPGGSPSPTTTLRPFGGTADAYLEDPSTGVGGPGQAGLTLPVWTSRTGGSQVVTYALDGVTAAPVVTDAGGFIDPFLAATSGTLLWVQPPTGDRLAIYATDLDVWFATAVDAATALGIAQGAATRLSMLYVQTSLPSGFTGNPQPLASLTNGTGNAAVGAGALALCTTGSSNFAVGTRALASLVTGSINTAVGPFAMSQAAPGVSDNIAIGQNAALRISGSGNIAIGDGAGVDIAGNSNIAIGGGTLNGNSQLLAPNGFTTAVGTFALQGSSPGADLSNCTGVGARALQSLTSGLRNTALGFRAGSQLTTGANNVAVGDGAGPTVASASNTSALGVDAKPAASNVAVVGGTGAAQQTLVLGGTGTGTGGMQGGIALAVVQTAPTAAPAAGLVMWADATGLRVWRAGAAAPQTVTLS